MEQTKPVVWEKDQSGKRYKSKLIAQFGCFGLMGFRCKKNANCQSDCFSKLEGCAWRPRWKKPNLLPERTSVNTEMTL